MKNLKSVEQICIQILNIETEIDRNLYEAIDGTSTDLVLTFLGNFLRNQSSKKKKESNKCLNITTCIHKFHFIDFPSSQFRKI